ncbi:MAG: M28 family peptidase [Bacteroidetes bacterium]|nr:MAG: M28 family peptidase [Bacteroidota bacterium]
MVRLGNWLNNIFLWLFICLGIFGCSEGDKKTKPSPQPVKQTTPKTFDISQIYAPAFNEDSAYFFLKKQVEFGPRVPGSEAHRKCKTYIVNTLKRYGFAVKEQKGEVELFNGKKIEITNIIAQSDTSANKKILLMAHYDTRPFADRDTKNRTKPILGANDGASGVAVLLEIARVISTDSIKPEVGIEMVFFDAEDYGQPQETFSSANNSNTWCLGSQYWAKNLDTPRSEYLYGILLDMVGGKIARFPKEGGSMYYAPLVVEKVWSIARAAGYGKYFVNETMYGAITDDHKYVNEIAHIPSIDIVHYEVHRNDFFLHHHKHSDNLNQIDKNTLKAVGQTLLYVIYSEK